MHAHTHKRYTIRNINIYVCMYVYIYFSDLPDMTDEYIDLSEYALTGFLLYVFY